MGDCVLITIVLAVMIDRSCRP